jgi:hypothetical protein
MLLFCEQCGIGSNNIYKLPFSMYIEEDCLAFPKNYEAYMSLCFECLSGNNPHKERYTT